MLKRVTALRRLLVWIVVGVLLAACAPSGSPAASPEPAATAPSAGESAMHETIDRELARARHLLRPERARVALREVQPLLDPATLGAEAGFGLAADDPDVFASVFFFADRAAIPGALAQLKAAAPTEGTRTLNGTNGRLLFFGYTRTDGPDGRAASFRLSDLISAFSGDE